MNDRMNDDERRGYLKALDTVELLIAKAFEGKDPNTTAMTGRSCLELLELLRNRVDEAGTDNVDEWKRNVASKKPS